MIQYTESLDGIEPEHLTGFFDGWGDPPSAEVHLRLLKASDHVLLALDDEAGRVVGFVTAVSDGVLSAYIPLLEVLPTYRGRGIGHELIRRMLVALSHLYMVDLACDEEMCGFYKALGFARAGGTLLRNLDRQSGRQT